jgi:hypothetical protein
VQDNAFFDVGRRTPELMLSEGSGFARLTALNLSIGRKFAPAKAKTQKSSTNASEAQMKQINRNMDDYVDWNVPWTFSFSYQ